jgi:DNA-binding GntR family transcriptional regulator
MVTSFVSLDMIQIMCYTTGIPYTLCQEELALTQPQKDLSQLPYFEETIKLDRTPLKDQAAEILRDHITAGRIPEGTRLTERQVSQMLGISRMPAREALMILEAEGLVERRFDGRQVIELSEKRVRELHQVRWTLERLAAELAAANVSEENCAALRARLCDLEEAIATGDPALCTERDLAIHQAIWRQADNSYLLELLESLLGVIFVLAARVKIYSGANVDRLRSQHRELVDLVTSGDADGAGRCIEAQLRGVLPQSLRTFHIQDHVDVSDS